MWQSSVVLSNMRSDFKHAHYTCVRNKTFISNIISFKQWQYFHVPHDLALVVSFLSIQPGRSAFHFNTHLGRVMTGNSLSEKPLILLRGCPLTTWTRLVDFGCSRPKAINQAAVTGHGTLPLWTAGFWTFRRLRGLSTITLVSKLLPIHCRYR